MNSYERMCERIKECTMVIVKEDSDSFFFWNNGRWYEEYPDAMHFGPSGPEDIENEDDEWDEDILEELLEEALAEATAECDKIPEPAMVMSGIGYGQQVEYQNKAKENK